MARHAGRLKFTGPVCGPYVHTMAKVAPPRRGPPRNNRIISLLRKQLRRKPATPNTILAENGNQLLAENGNFIRTES